MSDLISRQAAIDVLHGYFDGMLETDTVCPADIYGLFECIPSAQPERKKGRWIDEGFYADGHGVHAFRCSECGGHIIEYDADPFCRWCGADMKGER